MFNDKELAKLKKVVSDKTETMYVFTASELADYKAKAQVEAVRAELEELHSVDMKYPGGQALLNALNAKRHDFTPPDRLTNLKEDTSTTTATMPLPEIPFKEDGETK